MQPNCSAASNIKSKKRRTYQSVYMLWVAGSDLQDTGNPEVLIPFYVPLRGVLSSHIDEVIILVYRTPDCEMFVSSHGPKYGMVFCSLMKLSYFFIDSHSSLGVTV